MKIGLCVAEFSTNRVAANAAVIKAAAREARSCGIDLICFGEAVLQGFFSMSGVLKNDKEFALSKDSPEMKAIGETARTCRIAIAFGYIERDGESLFSSYMVIGDSGEMICNYRRISPGWKEKTYGPEYRQGESFGNFRYKGIDFSVGLCGDFWFDESLLTKEAIKGDYVLWPVFIDTGYKEWGTTAIADYAAQAKKIGRHVFLVNSILREKRTAQGRAVYFEDGCVKGELALDEMGMLECIASYGAAS